MQQQAISLYELNRFVRESIDRQQIRTWVIGEISEINFAPSGHVYIDLIEKSAIGGNLVAKLRCNMWVTTAKNVIPHFVNETGQNLAQGMKIMLYVVVGFHELYGISGNVIDINATFSVGEAEKQRRATIAQLIADGVSEMNKQLHLPTVIERIAVISARHAAGFGDYCNQMRQGVHTAGVHTTLFAATMQGIEAEQSIISALDRIAAHATEFDCVAIMRGGGARADLACFDHYQLASNVAQFPLPIISGIGHERDNSVVDFVAYARLKTPTAVAEYINSHNKQFADRLERDYEMLKMAARNKIMFERNALERHLITLHNIGRNRMSKEKADNLRRIKLIETIARNNVKSHYNNLHRAMERIKAIAQTDISLRAAHLETLRKQIAAYDPRDTLRRGYTITFVNNQRLKNIAAASSGDKMTTYTADGKITSTID